MVTRRRLATFVSERLSGWGLSGALVVVWLLFSAAALATTALWPLGGLMLATAGGVVVGLWSVTAFERTFDQSGDFGSDRGGSACWHWAFAAILVLGYVLGDVLPGGRAIRIGSVAVVFLSRAYLSGFRGPLTASVGALLLASLLFDGMLSVAPALTLYPLYVLLACVLLANEVAGAFARRGTSAAWLAVIQLLVVTLAVVSALGWIWFPDHPVDLEGFRQWIRSLGLLIEPSVNPNRMAGAVVCLGPLFVVLATGRPQRALAARRSMTALAVVALVALCGLVFLTQSRAAYLATAVACAALVVALLGRCRTGVVIAAASYVALVLLFLFGLFTPLVHWAGVAAHPEIAMGSYDSRRCFWDLGLEVLRAHSPSGIGVYTFDRVASAEFAEPYGHCAVMAWASRLYDVHNQHLQVAIDWSAAGYLAFVALNAALFRMAFRVYRRLPDTGTRWLVLGLAGGFVAQHVFWLTHVTRLSSQFSLFFWIMAGMVAGLYHHAMAASTRGGPS